MTTKKAVSKVKPFEPARAEQEVIEEMTHEQAQAILDSYQSRHHPKDAIKPEILYRSMGLSPSVLNSPAYMPDMDFDYVRRGGGGFNQQVSLSDDIRFKAAQLVSQERVEELKVYSEAMKAWADYLPTLVDDLEKHIDAKEVLGHNLTQAAVVKREHVAAQKNTERKARALSLLQISKDSYQDVLKDAQSDAERDIAKSQLGSIQQQIDDILSGEDLSHTYG
ncbi:hypothetical protein ACWJJH_14210 [Endozoicomonadaceae bacterium StTr2]